MNLASVVSLLETTDRINRARSHSDVLDLFCAGLAPYGFTATLVSGLPDVDPARWLRHIVANRWPREWFGYYNQHRLYRADPCVARAREAGEPFFWTDVLRQDLDPLERQVMVQATDFGLKQGICVPIARPYSAPAVVTVSGESIDLPADTLGIVQMMANHAYSQLVAAGQGGNGARRRRLSPREREVLLWMAEGKTAWEVSCILSLSPHTVGTHVRNAQAKLDAVNITHCVVEALRRQEIHL